jgi:flagellar hook-basal body complex protein FliE
MIVPPIAGLGGELPAKPAEALVQNGQPSAGAVLPSGGSGAPESSEAGAVEGGESGSFGGALTQAVSSLEQTQRSADGAAQALAAGTAKSPESAVVTVEDAQMAMQLASQIRTKATDAVQSIFQTQA